MASSAPDRIASVHDRYSDEEIASFYASGFWKAGTLFDLVTEQADRLPDKTFVFDSTTSLSYADFREQVIRLAAGLVGAGVGPGDRVAVQLPNWTEFTVIAVALARIGAVLVPIMPIYRDDEVGFVLDHSGATVAITCVEFRGFGYADMFAGLAQKAPGLRKTLLARADGRRVGVGEAALADLFMAGPIEDLNAALPAGSGPDDPYMIVYTSGTTSRPKGCLHTVNTLRASAAAIGLSLAYTDQDVQFGPSPITHSTGIVTSVFLPLLYGASSHLMEAWDPRDGMARIEKHGCTVSVTATAFLQMLMGVYDPALHNPASMRIWVCAGSPIPGSVVEQAATMLSGGQVLSLYGRSENMLTTMCAVTDPPSRSATSDGSALQGASVKVVDQDGTEVARGTEGDISYKGPSHMLEYYRDPEQTAALFTPDGYSRSGDLGVMDDDGFIRVTGRLKDIIIRGGLNVSARELEDMLMAHPAIGAVAVVGMPDERLGERVCVYVVPKPGQPAPTLADLIALMRERKIATTKLPERLEIVTELPMTMTGKVQKHLLRADITSKLRSESPASPPA